MSQALDQFRDLLAQLFQTSDSDLNFGIYRVLNQQRHHIDNFLTERLEPIVREALGAADDSQRAALQNELDALAKSATEAGFKAEDSPKWKTKKAELDALQTSQSLENEVYNGLHDFFGRYYDNGDFLARPRYRRDVYALPYNGEEVKLHWANRDQYYIKSARVLDEFGFELDGGKICFSIRPTQDGDGDNNKENRQFVLATDDKGAPMVENKDGVWTVQFDFKKPNKSGDDKDVLAVDAAPLLASVPQLSFASQGALQTKLRSWTRRKDWDFFVHKNLAAFLKRELDFYLKNEVVRLDGLLAGDADAWQKTTLAKAQAMHRLGGHLIEFLAQLEDLQKRLWEKQKWVTQSRIVIPWAKVPDSLRAQVLENSAQIAEWMALYGVENEAVSTENTVVWTNPPSVEWANNHRDIGVDSSHFDATWLHQLWSELSKTETLDELWNGILFNADNFAALNLMSARFQESVKCIYIDPPYNTENDDFLYKDSYQHSSWLSMMQDRLELAKELMSDDALFFVQIGDEEDSNLKMVLEDTFIHKNRAVVRRGVKNVQAQFDDIDRLNVGHENIHICAKAMGRIPHLKQSHAVEKSGKWDTFWRGTDRPTMRYELLGEHPERGQWRWEENRAKSAQSNYEIFMENESHSKTIDEWYVENLQVGSDLDFVRLSDEGTVQYYVPPQGFKLLSDNWLDVSIAGSVTDFAHEKNLDLMRRVINWNCNSSDLTLDYFAGSGTTGHAVMNLNRADNGTRRFVLCEMGRYFESVLLPRLKKAAFADKWKDGRPADFSKRNPQPSCLWSYRLESYEDALEHLAADIPAQDEQIAFPADDEFTVRYALSMNARDGVLPLSDEFFASPFAMQMRAGGEGEAKPQSVTLDAVATFNWLLGLRVHKMWWPGEELAAVCGLHPNGRAVVVVWRQLSGASTDEADAALLKFWSEDEILSDWRAAHEVETVFINGDSTLWRTSTAGEKWTAESLETKFRELMFATATTQSEVF